MFNDILNFANSETRAILDEADKISPYLLAPLYRIQQLDQSCLSADLSVDYKNKIEPRLKKYKVELLARIEDYLYMMANEYCLIGIRLGVNIETSEDVETAEDFRKLYKTNNFFAVSPLKQVIEKVNECFSYSLSRKPFWEIDMTYRYQNNSFPLYAKQNNLLYIKQIHDIITISENTECNNFKLFENFIKRRNSIPYKISLDFALNEAFPFYNSNKNFNAVMKDINDDLLLHEVLYCIKNDEALYATGKAFEIDVGKYLN